MITPIAFLTILSFAGATPPNDTTMYHADQKSMQVFDTGEKRMVTNDTAFTGFFLRTDIFDLLRQPGCVGIRFYNVPHLVPNENRMIAVGVTADGTEINQPFTSEKYILSPNAKQRGEGHKLLTRDLAKLIVMGSEQSVGFLKGSLFGFASFFSKSDLEQLLEKTNEGFPFDGIRFYVTPLKGTQKIQTHCAVSANMESNEFGSITDQSEYIVSKFPCPGYCSEPSAQGGEILGDITLPPGVSKFQTAFSDKYLVVW